MVNFDDMTDHGSRLKELMGLNYQGNVKKYVLISREKNPRIMTRWRRLKDTIR